MPRETYARRITLCAVRVQPIRRASPHASRGYARLARARPNRNTESPGVQSMRNVVRQATSEFKWFRVNSLASTELTLPNA